VVRLQLAVAVGVQLVERQRVAHVSEINELVDLAVGIAGDVPRAWPRALALIQARNRHDGKQLVQRPMIQQRLEDGKIAEILVAEAVFELANFLRRVGLAFVTFHHLAADLPVKVLDSSPSPANPSCQRDMCCASSRRSSARGRLRVCSTCRGFFLTSSNSRTRGCSLSPYFKNSPGRIFSNRAEHLDN